MRILIASLLFLIAACGSPSLDHDKASDLELNLEEFFDGRLVAYGQFQDRLGRIGRRFKVSMVGEWDGEMLTLTEDFTYSDGGTEQRVWSLRKTGEQTWEGTAEGVQGVAKGEERGDAFNWAYTIDLPLQDGGTTRVSFDDWMWLQSPDRLLNEAYMSKAGLRLGTVTIMFEKL